MKLSAIIPMLVPALFFVNGCALIPGNNDKSDEIIVTEAEPVAQLESTFLEGDTLWNFAERTTGSGFNWERIKELNAIADERNIDAGVVLLIPPELALEALRENNE